MARVFSMISKVIKYLILHNISKNFDEMLNYLKLKRGSFYSHRGIFIKKICFSISQKIFLLLQNLFPKGIKSFKLGAQFGVLEDRFLKLF